MNVNLTIYYSKANLSTRFADYSNVYVLPVVCAFGLLTSLASLVVAFQIKQRDHIVEYILANSLIDFLFLLTQFFLFLIRCGTLCPWGYTRASKLYENYIYLFVGYTLNTFQALFNLLMAIQCLRLFSSQRRRTNQIKNHWFYILFVILALGLNAPSILFSRELTVVGIYVAPNGKADYLYEWLAINAWHQGFLKLFRTLLAIMKTPFLYVLMGVFNILVAVRFRSFIRKKQTMTSQSARGRPFY
jgi:hypothetical protein